MIQFSHVSKVYDDTFVALSDVTLLIDKGEFVFLIGASGAGKTTLLKHIYMEEIPSKGQIFVSRYDSKYIKKREIPKLRREIGIVFQDFRLLSDRNVYENIAFAVRVTGKRERDVKRKVFEVLAMTGLSHKVSHYPAQLSGGEQQRVCIARAIANDPWVLIADEPTGNLDIDVSREIFLLLQKINSWGTTVIMATHDQFLINAYHYRQVVLDRGSLIQDKKNASGLKKWR